MAANPVWPYVALVGEREPLSLGPVENIWAHDWVRRPDLRVTVRHPHYPDQAYDTTPVEIEIGDARVLFAVEELSNGVYGVFAPGDGRSTG